LGHAAEPEIRVVDNVGEVVVIEKFDAVALDVVGPHSRLSESGGLPIAEGVECNNQLVEAVTGVEIIEISEMVPGDLRGEHVSFVPPCVGEEDEAAHK